MVYQNSIFILYIFYSWSGKNYRVSREYTDKEIREAIRLH